MRVLLAEDGPGSRADVADALEGAGFDVVRCGSVDDARARLGADPIALMVIDVTLLDARGVAFLREVRERASHLPVLLMSAETEVGEWVRGLGTKDDFVLRPSDVGQIVARVREVVAAQRSQPVVRPLVLLIEGHIEFRSRLSTALTAGGYEVLVCSSGEEGLRVATDRGPAAMLVALEVPDLDGPSLIRRVRFHGRLRGTPCLLVADSEDAELEAQMLQEGADAFARRREPAELIVSRLGAVMRTATRRNIEPPPSLLRRKRILVVDDSEIYLDLVREALSSDGHDVVLAQSGEAALELLALQSVDCVLLDVVMPGLGGRETCRRIKSTPVLRDIPLIVVSALDEREAMIDALTIGADDYIGKAEDLEPLRARVRAQTRRKQIEDENRHIREELLRRELEAAESRAAREVAEARAALVEELQRKNRELEAFSFSVSHDLRSPLSRIDALAAKLLAPPGQRSEEPSGHVAGIRDAARRMGELIEDLLRLSRVASGALDRRRVNLSELARSVAGLLVKSDPDRRTEIIIQEAVFASADARLVRVVLENLIGNAWKFTAVAPMTRIEFGVMEVGGAPTYFVRDNGAGFEMARSDELFRPFQRLHSDDEFRGTGIGLATARRVVERHSGRIWAEGGVGKGATFYFTLGKGPRIAPERLA